MRTEEWRNDRFFELVEQELQERGRVRFRVKGFSMQPMIRNNRDEVVMHRKVEGEPKRGDICLFRFNGRHILHRMVERKGEVIVFRGDNVFGRKEWCNEQEVLGVVEKVYRDGRPWNPKAWIWRVGIAGYRLYRRMYLWAYRVYALVK